MRILGPTHDVMNTPSPGHRHSLPEEAMYYVVGMRRLLRGVAWYFGSDLAGGGDFDDGARGGATCDLRWFLPEEERMM